MSPGAIVIPGVVIQRPAKMSFIKDDCVIKTLSTGWNRSLAQHSRFAKVI